MAGFGGAFYAHHYNFIEAQHFNVLLSVFTVLYVLFGGTQTVWGPLVGAAFFTWDVGMKKGDIQLLGVASYAAPLLSTLALILAGRAEPGWTILMAAILITGGALIAARKSG